MFDSFIKQIVKENLERQKNPPDYSYYKKMTIEEIEELGKLIVRRTQKTKMRRGW